MKPIDFDQKYADYAEKWVRENMGKYKSIDEMEQKLPELYLRYLNQPQPWLDGLTPAGYFGKYTDSGELIQLLKDYFESDIDVPDLLLERLTDLGEASIAPLMSLAADEGCDSQLRIIALNLLIEIGTGEPLQLCLQLIDGREDNDDVADVAAELVESRGFEAMQPMLDRLENASRAALATYLDLLCNFPGDERIYHYTVDCFLRDDTRRALFASYLAKIGDERAIVPLRNALNLSDLNYLDYIEIRNAIERLGSDDLGPELSFEGDPYYESLKHI